VCVSGTLQDALRRQDSIVFGRRGAETTDVEADETCFQSFSIDHDPPRHYFYTWLGVTERGSYEKLWLCPIVQSADLPLGVTMCEGEKRVPPLSSNMWRSCAKEVFTPDANLILHTDGAQAYAAGLPPGVTEWFWVNHSMKEFARSIDRLWNTDTGRRGPGMTGTMCIDRAWRSLKDQLPAGSLSARTSTSRDRFAAHIRAAQWKRMLGTADRWHAFCKAAQDYAAKSKAASDSEGLLESSLGGGIRERGPMVDDAVASHADGVLGLGGDAAGLAVRRRLRITGKTAQHELDHVLGGAVQHADDDILEHAFGDEVMSIEKATELLGACDGVPEEVHMKMAELVYDGAIAGTTAAQRRKQRKAGSKYAVPPILKDALAYGYIGPNLADPKNFKWVSRDGGSSWSLTPVPHVPLPDSDECILCTDNWACALHCLGERGDVPEAVHNSMEALRRRGAIPRTSLEQRQKSKMTSGSSYGVPPELVDALKWRYLHPDLPPPTGMKWICRGGKWSLAPLGG
jgi:hypothetical protein